MKRIKYIPGAFLLACAAILLFSCNLMSMGSGTLSITVPEDVLRAEGVAASGSKAIVPDGTVASYIRVYLEAQNSIVPLAGKTVYEAAISAEGILEIPGVAPVRDANLFLALSESGGTSFRAFKYAKNKATFSVIAGATTIVQMIAAYSPFADTSFLVDTANGVKSVLVDGVQYFLAGNALYQGTGASPVKVLDCPGALGLSKGKVMDVEQPTVEQLWINTDSGIYPLVGSELGSELTGIQLSDYILNTKILESGFISLTTTDDLGVTSTIDAAYYQRPGSVGVATYDKTTMAWDWIDLYDIFDPNNELYQEGMVSLKDLIKSNKGKLIGDFFIDPNSEFGYAVTALGSYRFGADTMDNVDTLPDPITFGAIQSTFLEGNTISVPYVDGQPALIKSLSHAGDILFIGTDKGIFRYQTNTDGTLIGAAQKIGPVPMPRRVNVVKIRAQNVTGTTDGLKDGVWTAVLGTRGSVHLIKDGSFVKEYQYYSGIPEFGAAGSAATGDIFWTDEGLVVTGTNGAVLLANDKLGA